MSKPNFGVTDENWRPMEVPSTTGEVLEANFKLGTMNSETLSVGRFIQTQMLGRNDDIIQPEQANELFPGVDIPFNEPISASSAATIQAHQEEKRRLQEIIAKGENSYTNTFLGFGATIAGAALDPIGILSGKALSNIGASFLNKTIGKAFLQGTKRRDILEQSIEGALGNVATEAAFVIPTQQAELEDINVTQNLAMAMTAGAAFPAAMGTIGAAISKLKGPKLDAAIALTEARIQADKNPNLSEVELELLTEEAGTTLKQEYEEAVANNDDVLAVEKANEIKEYEDKFNNQEEIRNQANDEPSNIYYNPEARDILQEIDNQPDTKFQEVLDSELAELDEPIRLEIEEEIAQYDNVDMNTFVKAAHFCVTKV